MSTNPQTFREFWDATEHLLWGDDYDQAQTAWGAALAACAALCREAGCICHIIEYYGEGEFRGEFSEWREETTGEIIREVVRHDHCCPLEEGRACAEITRAHGCACGRLGLKGCAICRGSGTVACDDPHCGEDFWEHKCTEGMLCPECCPDRVTEPPMDIRDHAAWCPQAIAQEILNRGKEG